MTRIGAALRSALSVAIVFAEFCYFGQTTAAQDPKPNNPPSAQEQPMPPDNPKPALETKMFTGKIVKSGNVLVLFVEDTKTNYKLDDQQKAKGFVNFDDPPALDQNFARFQDLAAGNIQQPRRMQHD
jgi:hypothetical protein